MKHTALKIFLSAVILLCAGVMLFANGQEEKKGGVTVVRYTRWAGTNEARDFRVLINTFEKSHPKIKIDVEFLPWNAYWDKLRTAFISGEVADVVSFSSNMSAPYVTKRALRSLNDIEGAATLLAEMHEGTKAAVTYENNIYGMPIGVGVRSLIYNKKMFTDAGLPFPDRIKPMTWNDMLTIGKKLTIEKDGEVIQYAAHFHKMEMYEALVVQAGGKLVDNYARPTKVLINSREGIRGLQFLLDMINNKVVPEYSAEWSGPWGTPDSALATKKVAMMQTGIWGLGAIKEAGIDFGTAPLFMDKNRGIRAPVNFLAIPKECRNVDAAWEFVKWMCGEGQLEFLKTGDLPTNKNALEEAKKQTMLYPPEITEPFFNELPYIFTGPLIPSDEFSSMIDTVISEMCQGKTTAAEAAALIEKQGNEIITRIYGD